MFKNYFILNRLIVENNSLYKDYTVRTVFTQEKEKLVFELDKHGDKKFIEISTSPNFEFMLARDSYSRAKKNTIDFFKSYLPSRIISFEISDNDRIIRINLESAAVYFFIRGKLSNILLIDSSGHEEGFKKIESSSFAELQAEINRTNFISAKNEIQFDLANETDYLSEVKKNFPILGKEILNEIRLRKENSPGMHAQKISTQIINEIFSENIIVYYDTGINKEKLSVKSFRHSQVNEVKEFDQVNEAIKFFLHTKYSKDDFTSLKNKIDKYLAKETERTIDRLNNSHVILQSESRESGFNKIANLLLINIHSIERGANKIKLEDIYNNNKLIEIIIDKSLSPRQNAEAYFSKAKSEKYKFERAGEQVILLTNKLNKMKNLKESSSASSTIEELKKIMKELKMPENDQHQQTDDIRNKFRNFVIDEKYFVFVGKDSANNDMLTTKFAKQNDYWFHARSVSGSHVVLRVDNTKEVVPKNILKKTASLAAFYSKAKTSSLAPVSYSLKKYVVKKKGMEPGKVAMLKEDVLIVKPEIPAGCEMLNKE